MLRQGPYRIPFISNESKESRQRPSNVVRTEAAPPSNARGTSVQATKLDMEISTKKEICISVLKLTVLKVSYPNSLSLKSMLNIWMCVQAFS